jgi:hypothetical protein
MGDSTIRLTLRNLHYSTVERNFIVILKNNIKLKSLQTPYETN